MRRQSGLSLLEVLVALAILAAGLGVLMNIFSTGLRNQTTSEGYGRAVEIARSAISTAEASLPDGAAESAGEAGPYRWFVSMRLESPAKEALGLVRIVARVEWSDGAGAATRDFTLSTLRVRVSK